MDDVYVPMDDATDAEEEIRECSIQLNVVRCLLAPHLEMWRRSSVFHTYIKHNDEL